MREAEGLCLSWSCTQASLRRVMSDVNGIDDLLLFSRVDRVQHEREALSRENDKLAWIATAIARRHNLRSFHMEQACTSDALRAWLIEVGGV